MMLGSLTSLVAQARSDDLACTAAATHKTRERKTTPRTDVQSSSVTLRYAFPDDRDSLERLAALDSAPVPAEPVLLAEVGGLPRAALSLTDGAVIADPFHPSTALIALLRARARQLHGSKQSGRRGRWGWPTLRPSPQRRS